MKYTLFGIGGVILLQIIILYMLKQPLICTCGYIKAWEGVVLSSGTSQHLSDWYTFSHIIHGIAFYALTWLISPRLTIPQRLLIAVGLEVGWEIAENTPWVINKYREQALAQGYVGDSILNSVSDTISMMIGFLIARKAPVWFTVTIVIALELYVGFSIRDNLTLNILNFIYPFEAIHNWQSGS